jgi:D-glycero-D-manno-heptose 1,7-bisphosphate phosphatase
VFLDRDGVLNAAVVRNGVPHPPETLGAVRLLPGVQDACARMVAAGRLLIVVTNQPDVARGICTREEVDAMNRAVTASLPVRETVVCPHDDSDGCRCRKPRPGMLLAAAARWNIDLRASFMVGDRWRDVAAGQAARTQTVFIDQGYDEQLTVEPDHVVASLAAAADVIVSADRSLEREDA